jgi:hypothetical protein
MAWVTGHLSAPRFHNDTFLPQRWRVPAQMVRERLGIGGEIASLRQGNVFNQRLIQFLGHTEPGITRAGLPPGEQRLGGQRRFQAGFDAVGLTFLGRPKPGIEAQPHSRQTSDDPFRAVGHSRQMETGGGRKKPQLLVGPVPREIRGQTAVSMAIPGG